MPDPSLLILVPAYNEERRIEPVLRDYAQYLGRNYQGQFQIIVVLNGCTDNTMGVVQKVSVEYPCVRALEFKEPIGKGGALIEGLKLAAHADLIGYTDADGATPARAFLDLVQRIGNADCVVGSRWLPQSIVHQAQTGNRQFASRVFHFIVQCLFGLNIRDTQCGAKVLKRTAVEKIHSNLRIADMAFDINLLYSLKHARFVIRELPTEWTDKAGSKVHLLRSSATMFLSVLRVRLIYSPFYKWLGPLRPLEGWIYRKLRAPQPLPRPNKGR
ncbi:MAG: glycosyltransferase family 2 protein [Verrucomicrobiota bacterium]|nr:glycosyltransferase family 2 protein [Verrucomicrobiota bacterium]